MNLLKSKQEFAKLSPQAQYDWLMKQDKSLFMIYLDNDGTELIFHSDKDCDYPFTFKKYLGDCNGVELLLKAIGINTQVV